MPETWSPNQLSLDLPSFDKEHRFKKHVTLLSTLMEIAVSDNKGQLTAPILRKQKD